MKLFTIIDFRYKNSGTSKYITVYPIGHSTGKVKRKGCLPHCTINRFRKDNGAALEGLFKQVLRLCKEAGHVTVGVVALDVSKIKANAALEANRTYEYIEQE